MRTATLAVILTLLLAYQAPTLVRRGALNRELVRCLKSSQCSDTPCRIPPGTNDNRATFFAGLGALKGGHPSEAVPLLRQYVTGKTRDDLATYYLGLACRYAGNEADALAIWRNGGLARLFAATGWREGSASALQTAIAVGDTNPATFYKLGDLLWDEGRVREAVATYQSGMALDKKESPARLLADARVFDHEGDWMKAVNLDEAFVTQQPGDSRGYLHAAEILRSKNLTGRAVTLYARCAERTGELRCYQGAGETCLTNKDIPCAMHWGNEARQIFPRRSEPLVLLASAWLAAGDLKDAARAYSEAASIDPRNFWIPLYQGDVATRSGDLDGALRYYNQALRLNPSSPVVYLSLGIGYQDRGDLDASKSAYRQALALAPGLTAAEKGLQEIEAQAARAIPNSGSGEHVR